MHKWCCINSSTSDGGTAGVSGNIGLTTGDTVMVILVQFIYKW